jgi:penicillin-binding protein 2
MADALGLGRKTGVPLSGESPGVIPGPKWLARVSPTERWSDGYTANVSIGQGACEASPLQMAMVVSTIANRGISYTPRLVHRIVDQNGKDAVDTDPESPTYGKLICPPEPKIRANLHDFGITDEQMELVRKGMWKVVNDPSGTGKKARIKGVEVAGKTGTAQFWREVHGKKEKDNHTWFICFAPYEKPKYAICIMVEGGKSGGGTSAPIAQRVLEESLAVENGYDPHVTFLSPAIGNFRPILEVSYKNTDKLPVGISEPEETSSDQDEPPPSRAKDKQVQAKPDIRDEPDARGRISAKRPQPGPPPAVEKRNFFQRFFGPRNSQPQAPPPKPFFGPRQR